MPVTKSAKKADRASNRKKVFNIRRKNKISLGRKNVNKLILAEKPDLQEITDALGQYYSALDKAVKTNYIEKNKASRLKSRITLRVAKLEIPGTVTAKVKSTVAKAKKKSAVKKVAVKKKIEDKVK